MKRITYISPYFWPEIIGSAPYCTDLAVWLERHGYRVHVVSFRPHYPNISDFPDRHDGRLDLETYQGVRISRVPVCEHGSGSFPGRMRNDLGFLAYLARRYRSA